jgi:ring-1,2-phenylacetyl-CoA epoxidase subunit PaaC
MHIDEKALSYMVRLGDNSLILGHRLSQWCGHGPVLEVDIALTNTALDLIGQARTVYEFAARAKGLTEDHYAYWRDENEFQNFLITELPKGDFGYTIVRQFLVDAFQYFLYEKLQSCSHTEIAAFAEKSFKETSYHLRFSSEWLIRLGDGTQESHARVAEPLEELWPYTGEMFEDDEIDLYMAENYHCALPSSLKSDWIKKVDEVFYLAMLTKPEHGQWHQTGGKSGRHTEHLGYILAETQSLARKHPQATW